MRACIREILPNFKCKAYTKREKNEKHISCFADFPRLLPTFTYFYTLSLAEESITGKKKNAWTQNGLEYGGALFWKEKQAMNAYDAQEQKAARCSCNREEQIQKNLGFIKILEFYWNKF